MDKSQWKKLLQKKYLVPLSVFCVFCILLAVFIPSCQKQKDKAQERIEATVMRGTISKTVEGTGTIAAIDQYTISALVSGEVIADTFLEGDMVEKDDLLYTIDSTNLDYNIQKAQSGVETARLNYEESMKNHAYQFVTAPMSGVITELFVKEGDEVNTGTKLFEMVNQGELLLTLDFLAEDAQNILPGAAATVSVVSSPGETLFGTVKRVATGSITNSSGARVTTLEIAIQNPGGLLPDTSATAIINGYACNAPGTLSYTDSKIITAKTGGEVTELSCHRGDYILEGTQILKLLSENTENNVEKTRISFQDAKNALENAYDQLEDYQIRAPISGKVIQKNVKAGDKLENGSGSNAASMATIADLSMLTFEMSVDELDISDIQKGQKVRVTADAAKGQTFIGTVETVSIIGTSQNGVTSYPVKVVLDGEACKDLIPGMNVNATIQIEERANVLTIPVSAVSRDNLVCVKADNIEENKEIKQKTAPAGYTYVQIETGISDGNVVEVLSGLREGDVLLLPDMDSNGEVAYTRESGAMMMGGMPQGMGGGMPSGMRGGMSGSMQ